MSLSLSLGTAPTGSDGDDARTAFGKIQTYANANDTALTAKAPLASPTFTGTPAAPTATSGTNTTQIATTAFVAAAIAALINSAPGALDTLDELAAALGDDSNFAATIAASLASINSDITTLEGQTVNVAVNQQTGTTYTAVAGDAFGIVEMNNASANTLTIPPNSSVAFGIPTNITVCQTGAGQTTIAAGSGVTITTPETLKIGKQYGLVTLVKVATNVWRLDGNLEAA